MAKKHEMLEDTIEFDLEVGFKDKEGNVHKTVVMREITGYDEETISKPEIRNSLGKTITTLLANTVLSIGTITAKDYGSKKWENLIKSLPLGDRDKMMLELRKLTNGDEIELDFKCPHRGCKSKIKHYVEIDHDIEVKELEVDPNAIPFTLPKGIKNDEGQVCKEGVIRLPNGEDQEIIDTQARKNLGNANTQLLARLIESIDGIDDINLSLVRGMSTRDRDYLLRLLADSAYGPKFEITFSCPSCGEDIDYGVHPVNFL